MNKKKNFNKTFNNETRRNFLLTFFDKDEYQEIDLNGFKLVKNWDANYKRWQVAIFRPEQFEKYKKFNLRAPTINDDMMWHINKPD